jgi:Leucine-rich repeat (LRR) protein
MNHSDLATDPSSPQMSAPSPIRLSSVLLQESQSSSPIYNFSKIQDGASGEIVRITREILRAVRSCSPRSDSSNPTGSPKYVFGIDMDKTQSPSPTLKVQRVKDTHKQEENISLDTLRRIDASRLSLRRVPSELSSFCALTELNISQNKIQEDISVLFSLCHLQLLDLSGNQLCVVDKKIKQLSGLQVLRLDNNELTEIPSEMGDLGCLRELSVQRNALQSLPPTCTKLTQLKSLDLSNNKGCPTQPLDLPLHLQVLRAQNNDLILFPVLRGVSQLVELDLDGNSIREVTTSAVCASQLVMLNLDENDISESVFSRGKKQSSSQSSVQTGQIPNILSLKLRRNRFSSLPHIVSQATSLRSLCLRSNFMERVPQQVCQMHSLQQIELGNNELEDLPEGLEFLTQLQHLGLEWNMFHRVPSVLFKLPSLKTANAWGEPSQFYEDLEECQQAFANLSITTQLPASNTVTSSSSSQSVHSSLQADSDCSR